MQPPDSGLSKVSTHMRYCDDTWIKTTRTFYGASTGVGPTDTTSPNPHLTTTPHLFQLHRPSPLTTASLRLLSLLLACLLSLSRRQGKRRTRKGGWDAGVIEGRDDGACSRFPRCRTSSLCCGAHAGSAAGPRFAVDPRPMVADLCRFVDLLPLLLPRFV